MPTRTPRATSTSGPTNTPQPTPTEPIAGIPEGEPFTEALYWFFAEGYPQYSRLGQALTPQSELNRGEAAMMYCRLIYQGAKLPVATGTFTDVDAAEYPELSACLEQLYRDGYISGTSTVSPRYEPEKPLLLGAMAVLQLRGLYNEPFAAAPGWQPSAQVSGDPWGNYFDAVWAYSWGEYLIRNGYYDLSFGRFTASEPASVAEVSMAFYAVAHK